MSESRYLSLEDFKKTDEKSQEKVMKELNSDNESKQYLYWMEYAMDENDLYREKMTPLAFRGGNELSKETQEILENEKENLEYEIDAIQHAMVVYAEEKGIDLDDALNDKDDDEEFESIYDFDEDDDEEDSEDDNLEEEQKEAKAIKQSSDFCKLMNEKLSELTKKKEAIDKQLENDQNNNEDEEFSDSMNKFNMAAKSKDVTRAKELDAVGNNLKTATKLLYDNTARRQIKLLIKPAAIQKLLTTFQNLRKTQLDNVLKTIPSNLPTERKKALVTIYKNDFWEAYEQEVRNFLSEETNMLKSTDKIIAKLKNKGNKIKEKVKNKKDEIVTKVKSKLDFELKSEEKYDNVLDTMDFEKKDSEDYSDPQGKGDSVQQKIIDLVASTLRPKDAKNDGRSEENTYGGYYSEIQKFMDKYMKDDDYDRYNSKGKDLKVGELRCREKDSEDFSMETCRFTYILFAILMDCAGKGNDETTFILKGKYNKINTMFDVPLIRHEIFEGSSGLENGKFGKIYKKLKECCTTLADSNLSAKDVETLLGKFSDAGVSDRGKLFYKLCQGGVFDLSKGDDRAYFAKIIKLKDAPEINQSTNNSENQNN